MASPTLSLDHLLKQYENPKPDPARFYNEPQLQQILRIVQQHIGVVCQVQTPTDKGTGCLIGGNLLITNYHIIPDKDKKCHALFFRIISQDVDKKKTTIDIVRIGLDPSRYYYSSSQKKEGDIVLAADAEHLDFVIVALEPDPYLEEVQGRVFSVFNKAEMKSLACILQHPDVIDSKTALQGDLKWSIGLVHQREGCSIHYDTETAPGSSGGAVMNEKGDLIALHYQGLGSCGCDPRHPYCNAGVVMTEIVLHLEKKGERAKIEETIKRYHQEISLRLPQLVQSLANHLSDFYQEQITAVYKVRAKGAWTISLPVDGVFTDLAIICEEERKTKNDSNKASEGVPIHETLFKFKHPIASQDIFNHKELKNALRKRVVIFGVAGVGKTTFCQMLARKGRELWPQFKVIFFIKLRNLNEKKYPRRSEGYIPYEILTKECGFDLTAYQPLLKDSKFLEESLLLLDGYDELPKEAESGSLSETFRKLQELFPHILMTSRPTLVNMDYLTELEILGFNRQNVDTYIEKFYGLLAQRKELSEDDAKRKTNKLQQAIKKRPILTGLLQIPINLSLACSLCREDEEFFDSHQTISVSSFYLETVNWFYKKYQLRPGVSDQSEASIRQQKNPRAICKKVDQLATACEEIAWWAMQQNTLYIDQEVIEKNLGEKRLSLDDLTHLGLLSLEKGQGQFIHLTFQEYFAAVYLARFYTEGKQKEGYEILRAIKFNPQYSITISLIAGYLSCQEKAALKAFFKDLTSEPDDLAVGYELRLLARSFEECQDPADIEQYNGFIERVIAYLQEYLAEKLKSDVLVEHPRLLQHEKILGLFNKKLVGYYTEKMEYIKFIHQLVSEKQFFDEKFLILLMNILKDSKADSDLRGWVARTLGEMAKNGQSLPKEVIDNLLMLIRYKYAYSESQNRAVEALGEIAKNEEVFPQEAIDVLLELVRDQKTEFETKNLAGEAVIEVLKKGQVLHKEAVENLFVLIRDEKANSESRFASVVILIMMYSIIWQKLPKDRTESFLALIRNPKTEFLSLKQEAESLAEVAKRELSSQKEAIEILLAELSTSYLFLSQLFQPALKERNFLALIKDPNVDHFALDFVAVALADMVKNGQVSAESFQELIKNPRAGSFALGAAAETLREVTKSGQTVSKEMAEGLIEVFKKPKVDLETVRSAAQALGEIVKSGQFLSEEAMQELLRLIRNRKVDISTRFGIKNVISDVVKSGLFLPDEEVEKILEFIKDSKNQSFDAVPAIETLEVIAKNGQILSIKVVEDFFVLINDPQADSNVKGHVARVLGEVAKKNQKLSEEALKCLIALVRDPKTKFLHSVTQALGEVAKSGRALPQDVLTAICNDYEILLKNTELLLSISETCCKLLNHYDYQTLRKLFFFTGRAFYMRDSSFYTSGQKAPLITGCLVDNKSVYKELLGKDRQNA